MIKITTVDEFLAINNNLEGEYQLVNDIDFGGVAVEPLGEFKGILDGNDYVIKNLYLNLSEQEKAGMIKVNQGIIKNLNFSNIKIKGLKFTGLVAINEGEISNCKVVGKIDDVDFSGGIAGFNKGNINKCFVDSNLEVLTGKNAGEIKDSQTKKEIEKDLSDLENYKNLENELQKEINDLEKIISEKEKKE